MRTLTCPLLALALASLPATALAQEDTEPVDVERIDIEPTDLGARTGITVLAQGGMQAYLGTGADAVEAGGAYGLLVGIGTSDFLGLELGYQGAAYATQDGANGILENGGQALIKLNPQFGRWEPYGFVGVGASRLTVRGDSAQVDDDTLVKVPVGAGFDVRFPRESENAFLVGGRAGYGFVFSNDAFAFGQGNSRQLNVTLQVGGRF